METISEQETRRLRNLVFGHTITDKSWESIKDQWMRPEEMTWLVNKAIEKKIPLTEVKPIEDKQVEVGGFI